MKKNTQNLSKRLAQYGALTVAIAGVADASGQIVYTDVAPDFNGGINTDYALDLNNDGIVDFEITQSQSSYLLYGYFPMTINFLGIIPTTATNEVLVDNPLAGNYAYPFALDEGAIISAGQETWNNNGYNGQGYQSLIWNYSLDVYGSVYSGSDGNFSDVTNKYLGLRFEVAGEIHYGWARLDVNTDGTSWTIKDYAYNAVPNEGLEAGQTLNIGDYQLEKVKIIAINKKVELYNLSGNTHYNLYSITGQSVMKGSASGDTHVIEASSTASGIYILELHDIVNNAILRKKIAL